MSDAIIVAVFSAVASVLGTFGGIVVSSKLTNYRLEQLEKRVEQHNCVVEKTAINEHNIRVLCEDIKELKEAVHRV